MPYPENREKSAEILRLIIPHMARQSAAFHPLSYTVWYEHLSGVNPALSAELGPRMETGVPLTEQDIAQLHGRHIVERDVQEWIQVQDRLRALLAHMTQNATHAGTQAGDFAQQLVQRKSELLAGIDHTALGQIVGDLLALTVQMQSASQSLAEKLESASHEVNALNERLNQAQCEALIDPLTGLKNRRGLERALSESAFVLEGATLLMLDIDHFKRVNDRYGHLLGDKVIHAVAQTLHDSVKGRDIAARTGGEEFAVLLPETPLRGAVALAEQLRATVARGRIHRGSGTETIGGITISLGAAAGTRGESFERLMARADAALYAAKRAGRNRVTVSRIEEHVETN